MEGAILGKWSIGVPELWSDGMSDFPERSTVLRRSVFHTSTIWKNPHPNSKHQYGTDSVGEAPTDAPEAGVLPILMFQ
jgi:hypothetical protein